MLREIKPSDVVYILKATVCQGSAVPNINSVPLKEVSSLVSERVVRAHLLVTFGLSKAAVELRHRFEAKKKKKEV